MFYTLNINIFVQQKTYTMKKGKLYLMGLAVPFIISCESHPSFKNSADVVEGCQKELVELKKTNDLPIDKLAKVTSYWLEIQDSAYSVFGRDSTISLRSPVAMSYFIVSDSIRSEISRIAFSQQRTLKDVMYLKLNTANGVEKIRKSDTYKEAVGFFDNLDKQSLYNSLQTTLSAYSKLLGSARKFRNGQELIDFIAKEDICFRSLMAYLSQVSSRDLKLLTDETSVIFNDLYSSIGNNADDVNDHTMLYLTMRFNRRIVQNALACKNDIQRNVPLSKAQMANYRWMLIQPFMAIDDYSTKVLTDNQKEELLNISNELPSLLGKLEIKSQTKEQEEEFNNVLANYFLKTYLSTSL